MKSSTLQTLIPRELRATVAARVAPEDLHRGDFVAVLSRTLEFPSFYWPEDSHRLDPRELVRLSVQARDGGIPLKVQGSCLPFVLLKTYDGGVRTEDIRQTQFVRLDRDYAKLVWKELRKQAAGVAKFLEG